MTILTGTANFGLEAKSFHCILQLHEQQNHRLLLAIDAFYCHHETMSKCQKIAHQFWQSQITLQIHHGFIAKGTMIEEFWIGLGQAI
jgi:hypothetical protein